MVKISGVHKNICHLNEETSGGAGAVTRGGAAGTAARLEAGGREKEVSESPALVEVVVGGGEVRLATGHSTLGKYKIQIHFIFLCICIEIFPDYCFLKEFQVNCILYRKLCR